MIKLDEKDVRAVARSRIHRQKKWKYLMLPPGVIIILIIISDSLGWENLGWILPSLIAMLVYLSGMIVWYSVGEKKAESKLVKEWKKEE